MTNLLCKNRGIELYIKEAKESIIKTEIEIDALQVEIGNKNNRNRGMARRIKMLEAEMKENQSTTK